MHDDNNLRESSEVINPMINQGTASKVNEEQSSQPVEKEDGGEETDSANLDKDALDEEQDNE